jgi:hypothetical protein
MVSRDCTIVLGCTYAYTRGTPPQQNATECIRNAMGHLAVNSAHQSSRGRGAVSPGEFYTCILDFFNGTFRTESHRVRFASPSRRPCCWALAREDINILKLDESQHDQPRPQHTTVPHAPRHNMFPMRTPHHEEAILVARHAYVPAPVILGGVRAAPQARTLPSLVACMRL